MQRLADVARRQLELDRWAGRRSHRRGPQSERLVESGALSIRPHAAIGLDRLLCLAQLNLLDNALGPEGAAAIGEALKVNGSLTSLNVSVNKLDDASKGQLRDIVKDRSGFQLRV